MLERKRARRAIRAAYEAIPFKQPLFTLLRYAQVPTPIMRHLRFDGVIRVDVDTAHAFRMYNHATFIENDLFWRGYGESWEATSLKLWRKLVPHAGTILDIGANTGVYSLAARSLNPDAAVIAFEPLARVFQTLEQNIALNAYNIRAERLAVSDRSGVATIFDLPEQHTYNASLEFPHRGRETEVVPCRVFVVRIDEYMARHRIPNIDLAKIDVEHHEASVLRGFGELLASRPTVMVEVLTDAVAAEIGTLIQGLGYDIYHIAERRGLRRIDAVYAAEGGQNLLLCKPEIFSAAGLESFLAQD